MTRIYLIRHAEAEGNAYRRAHGHYNGQIAGRGFAQINALRKRFENEKIDCIYSSNLDRTCTTATALSEPRNLTINTTSLLREVDMGVWEGAAWGNLEHDDPDMVKLFGTNPSKWRVERSEPYEQVQSRMFECISNIGKKHFGETVAAFSHGFSIKALLCKLSGIESHESDKIPYCDNTAVSLLIYDNDVLSIEYHSDNSHLNNDTSTFFNQTWWRLDGERIKENLRFHLIDSFDELACLNHDVKNSVANLDMDMTFLAFLDMDPVGVIGLDSSSDAIGLISYYYVSPKHKDRNFLDQLIGQALSVLCELGKKTMRVKVLQNDEYAKSIFSKYGFGIVDTADFNIFEKEIL